MYRHASRISTVNLLQQCSYRMCMQSIFYNMFRSVYRHKTGSRRLPAVVIILYHDNIMVSCDFIFIGISEKTISASQKQRVLMKIDVRCQTSVNVGTSVWPIRTYMHMSRYTYDIYRRWWRNQ